MLACQIQGNTSVGRHNDIRMVEPTRRQTGIIAVGWARALFRTGCIIACPPLFALTCAALSAKTTCSAVIILPRLCVFPVHNLFVCRLART